MPVVTMYMRPMTEMYFQDAFAGHLEAPGLSLTKYRRYFNKLFYALTGICRRMRPQSNTSSDTQENFAPKPPKRTRPSIWSVPFGNRKNPEFSTNQHVTWPFQRKRIHKYLLNDVETFFSPTQRMEIVWEILQRSRNDPNDEKRRGVESLLGLGVYHAAFPLHDGDDDPPPTKGRPDDITCDRHRLKKTWASWGCIFQTQPIELIRR